MDDDREAGARDERVRNLERTIDQLITRIGKLESDLMNVRTELAAGRGRDTMRTIVDVVWPVVVGMIVLIVVMVMR